jgi:RNA polymerase sigma factor (sigma-70 family)
MGNSPKRQKKGAKKQEHGGAGAGSFPQPLSPEDERCYMSLYKSGDKNQKKLAKDMLVEHNLRLVAHIVKKYNHPDTEDLISIGTIGLIKGIEHFDSERKTKLATFCCRCIENAILRCVTRQYCQRRLLRKYVQCRL